MFRLAFLLVALVALTSGTPVPDIFRGGRIVGGRAAVLGEYPYQVSLRTAANFHFCGGAIISQTWVITAAHCIINRAQTSVRVIVGSVLLNSGGSTHTSSRIIAHEDYNSALIAFDVGVVEVSEPFTFTANVRAIPMASAATGGGVTAVVTGWGGTAITGGAAPNNLQTLTTTTLTNADCISRHTVNNQRFVLDHKICTFTQAGQGICQGDSGGPLTAGGALIGTVSWNIPCARGFPDAFDRTAWFRSWVTARTGIN